MPRAACAQARCTSGVLLRVQMEANGVLGVSERMIDGDGHACLCVHRNQNGSETQMPHIQRDLSAPTAGSAKQGALVCHTNSIRVGDPNQQPPVLTPCTMVGYALITQQPPGRWWRHANTSPRHVRTHMRQVEGANSPRSMAAAIDPQLPSTAAAQHSQCLPIIHSRPRRATTPTHPATMRAHAVRQFTTSSTQEAAGCAGLVEKAQFCGTTSHARPPTPRSPSSHAANQ